MSRIKRFFAKELDMEDMPLRDIAEMNARYCQYCGKKLHTADRRVKYCSEKCRKNRLLDYQKNYFKERYYTEERFRTARIERSTRYYRNNMRERMIEVITGIITEELDLDPKQQDKLKQVIDEKHITMSVSNKTRKDNHEK